MAYCRTVILAFVFIFINLALGPVQAFANEDSPESTFWQDRAAKAKKVTTPAKAKAKSVNSPAKAVKSPVLKSTKKTTRRVVVETAPSGQPPAGEARFLTDQVIVRFRLSARQSDMDRLVGGLSLVHLEGRTFKLAGVTVHRYQIADGGRVAETIAALEANETVVSAQPNYLYQPQQDKAAKPGQYALARLAVEPLGENERGAGVRLAIIDSIVDVAHPEFTKAKIEAYDVSDAPGAGADAHGTGIAGIAAAGSVLAGIAPGAEIVAIAAFAKAEDGKTYGNSWTVAKALDLAADKQARVVNMSFAGPSDPLLARTIDGAGQRGIIMIAAAGNDGPTAAALFPAAYDGTIGVTAIDEADAIYANANRGAYVELAAPGVNILTAAPGGTYNFLSGTSLASAHVSALAALLLGVDPKLTREQLAAALTSTSIDLGAAGRDEVFGSGVPNAKAALGQIGAR